jgi:transcriptional regulator with XRE-family HTH domain
MGQVNALAGWAHVERTKPTQAETDAQGVPGRFKQSRKDLKIKAKDLARDAALEPPQISHFESGRKGLDTPALLALLSAASRRGINVDYVLRGARSQAAGDLVVADRTELRAIFQEIAEANPSTEGLSSDGIGGHRGNSEQLKQRPDRRTKRRARK